jgi:hypothetical protein
LTVQEALTGETIRLSTAKREFEARVRECKPSEGGYALCIEILNQGVACGTNRLTAAFLGAAGAVVGLFFAVLLSVSSGTAGHAKQLPAVTGHGPADVPGPPPLPGENVEQHLELRAANLSWVTVCADGKKVLERLFEQGETADIPYVETAVVRAGNAAGLEVTVGGQALGTLGPWGAIRMLRASGEKYEYTSGNLNDVCQAQ